MRFASGGSRGQWDIGRLEGPHMDLKRRHSPVKPCGEQCLDVKRPFPTTPLNSVLLLRLRHIGTVRQERRLLSR